MRLVGLVLFSVALGLAPSVYAQEPASPSDDVARSLFDAGAIAYSEGRYGDALELFERSHALSQRPELLYNIALAHDRLRHDREALEAFRAYLEGTSDGAPHRDEVVSRVAVLERTLEARRALEARVNEALAEPPSRRTRRAVIASSVIVVVAAVVAPIISRQRRAPETTPSDFGGPITARFGGAR